MVVKYKQPLILNSLLDSFLELVRNLQRKETKCSSSQILHVFLNKFLQFQESRISAHHSDSPKENLKYVTDTIKVLRLAYLIIDKYIIENVAR